MARLAACRGSDARKDHTRVGRDRRRGETSMSDEGKYLFVDEQLRYTTGEEAARALASRSDAPFFTEGQGVLRVPKTRWREAQHYERDTWLVANADAADDRNDEHEEGFGGYGAL